MSEVPFAEVYAALRARRDELHRQLREEPRFTLEGEGTDQASELWHDHWRGCWALQGRQDARVMYRRGRQVVCGPEDETDRESWLNPTLSSMMGEMEQLVAHYTASVGPDAGPARSASAALRVLRIIELDIPAVEGL